MIATKVVGFEGVDNLEMDLKSFFGYYFYVKAVFNGIESVKVTLKYVLK